MSYLKMVFVFSSAVFLIGCLGSFEAKTNPESKMEKSMSCAVDGICSASNCSAGFHLEDGVCAEDSKICEVPNGTGSQIWTGSSYSACVANSCNQNFALESGVCVNNPNIPTTTKENTNTIVAVDTEDQSTSSMPIPKSCTAGFHLQDGVCTEDNKICEVPNGTGSQIWTGSSYSACVANSCNQNFVLKSGSCIKDSSVTSLVIDDQLICAVINETKVFCKGHLYDRNFSSGTEIHFPVEGKVKYITANRGAACAIVGESVFCWGIRRFSEVTRFVLGDAITPLISSSGPFQDPIIYGQVVSGSIYAQSVNFNILNPVKVLIGPHFTCANNNIGAVSCIGKFPTSITSSPYTYPGFNPASPLANRCSAEGTVVKLSGSYLYDLNFSDSYSAPSAGLKDIVIRGMSVCGINSNGHVACLGAVGAASPSRCSTFPNNALNPWNFSNSNCISNCYGGPRDFWGLLGPGVLPEAIALTPKVIINDNHFTKLSSGTENSEYNMGFGEASGKLIAWQGLHAESDLLISNNFGYEPSQILDIQTYGVYEVVYMVGPYLRYATVDHTKFGSSANYGIVAYPNVGSRQLEFTQFSVNDRSKSEYEDHAMCALSVSKKIFCSAGFINRLQLVNEPISNFLVGVVDHPTRLYEVTSIFWK